MVITYIMGTHTLSLFVLGIFLLTLLPSQFQDDRCILFQDKRCRSWDLYDEKTSEIQNADSSVKGKTQKFLVEPKIVGGPIAAGILF